MHESLKVLNLSREGRKETASLIEDYALFNGQLMWKEKDLPKLQKLVQEILGISDKDFEKLENADDLRKLITLKLGAFSDSDINQTCFILTVKRKEGNE